MTEQPDTAAIRAWYDVYLDVPGNQVIRALCDALDAARAELERERVMHRGIDPEKARYSRWWRQEKARAEAAEAQLATERKANSIAEGQWAERCYDAEARIAKALATLPDSTGPTYRALTD